MATYSSKDLCEGFSVTARLLQWWDEQRLLRATLIGHRREFKDADLITLAALLDLRRRGVSLQRCRKAIAVLAENMPRLERWIFGKNLRAYLVLGLPPGKIGKVTAQVVFTIKDVLEASLEILGALVVIELGRGLIDIRTRLLQPRKDGCWEVGVARRRRGKKAA